MPRMKFFVDSLTPEILKRAEEELGETDEIRNQSLMEIKELIKKEPDFHPLLEEVFLLRFLRHKKFNVKNAFESLRKYYKYKARYSRIVTDFKPSELKTILDECYFSILEHRDNEDVGVMVILFGKIDNRFTADQILAATAILIQLLLEVETTQIVGYSVIYEFTGYTLSNAQHYFSFAAVYRGAKLFQDFISIRLKSCHIVNAPTFFNFMFNIAKKFVSEKLLGRVHFHSGDLTKLYNHIPKDILPNELGGTQGPLSNSAKDCNSRLFKLEEHFIETFKYGYQGETLERLRK